MFASHRRQLGVPRMVWNMNRGGLAGDCAGLSESGCGAKNDEYNQDYFHGVFPHVYPDSCN
jgi:hypothetical protein